MHTYTNTSLLIFILLTSFGSYLHTMEIIPNSPKKTKVEPKTKKGDNTSTKNTKNEHYLPENIKFVSKKPKNGEGDNGNKNTNVLPDNYQKNIKTLLKLKKFKTKQKSQQPKIPNNSRYNNNQNNNYKQRNSNQNLQQLQQYRIPYNPNNPRQNNNNKNNMPNKQPPPSTDKVYYVSVKQGDEDYRYEKIIKKPNKNNKIKIKSDKKNSDN